MKHCSTTAVPLLLCAVLFCSPANAGTFAFTFGGELNDSGPTFINPDSEFTEPVFFDIYEITVPVTGLYHVLSYYPADESTGEFLDGFFAIYQTFPGGSIMFNDNYSAGGIEALADYDSQCVGQNCSAFSVLLTAGVTFTFVQTASSASPEFPGLSVGSYQATLVGPGQIVPLPAAFGLLGTALAAMGFLRR